jgi:hypothetical protein
VLQSGQPYSIVDFSGAVGSIYYSTYDGITNPIVPLAAGCTAKSAKTGATGAFPGHTALNPACFTVPVLPAGGLGGAIPDGSNNSNADPYETNFTKGQRNIFRQSPQRRADISLIKTTEFRERYNLKYTFDVFNLSNTASFDIPGNEVYQNQYYDQAPVVGTPVLPTSCTNANTGFYNCAASLGVTTHTIGSPRQIQMSLHLVF